MAISATSLITNAAASRDPTRTVVLRAKYAANMRGRWGRMLAEGKMRLGEHDFPSKAAFSTWLRGAMDEQVLEDGGQWQRQFLKAGYGRGVKQADVDVKAGGLTLPKEGLARRQLLEGIHANEIKEMTQRYSTDLQTITNVVAEQVEQVAFEAWDEDNLIPRVEDRVRKVGMTRGTVLAVTSIIDVFALGTLNRLDSLGFRRVSLIPEVIFTTAGDFDVCQQCIEIEDQAFDVFSARGILPVHPRCRCRWTFDVGSLAGLALLAL